MEDYDHYAFLEYMLDRELAAERAFVAQQAQQETAAVVAA